MKKLFILFLVFFLYGCASGEIAVEKDTSFVETVTVEEPALPTEDLNAPQSFVNPFPETPYLIKSLASPTGIYELRIYSDQEGGCVSGPSAENCAYAVWDTTTNALIYSKEPSSWTDWSKWGGAMEWEEGTTVLTFSSFGDSGASWRSFHIYDFATQRSTEIWKLYLINLEDKRLFALDFEGETYLLDDSKENIFTIYKVLDPAFVEQYGDSIGEARILYDKLQKMDDVNASGELTVQNNGQGLLFNLGEEFYRFDLSTGEIVSQDQGY